MMKIKTLAKTTSRVASTLAVEYGVTRLGAHATSAYLVSQYDPEESVKDFEGFVMDTWKGGAYTGGAAVLTGIAVYALHDEIWDQAENAINAIKSKKQND